MSLFNVFNIASSSLSAESQRLNAIASNLANAPAPGLLSTTNEVFMIRNRAENLALHTWLSRHIIQTFDL